MFWNGHHSAQFPVDNTRAAIRQYADLDTDAEHAAPRHLRPGSAPMSLTWSCFRVNRSWANLCPATRWAKPSNPEHPRSETFARHPANIGGARREAAARQGADFPEQSFQRRCDVSSETRMDALAPV